MRILLLGPGKSHRRLDGPDIDPKVDDVVVFDRNKSVLDYWQNCGADPREVWLELGWPPDLLEEYEGAFDEIHGYEIFNLLPGDCSAFYGFWNKLYFMLKPGGKVFGTTPHWQSQWIHAYPGAQRTYTVPLLMHLDAEATLGAQEDFSEYWGNQRLKIVKAEETRGAQGPQGFRFVLKKC